MALNWAIAKFRTLFPSVTLVSYPLSKFRFGHSFNTLTLLNDFVSKYGCLVISRSNEGVISILVNIFLRISLKCRIYIHLVVILLNLWWSRFWISSNDTLKCAIYFLVIPRVVQLLRLWSIVLYRFIDLRHILIVIVKSYILLKSQNQISNHCEV